STYEVFPKDLTVYILVDPSKGKGVRSDRTAIRTGDETEAPAHALALFGTPGNFRRKRRGVGSEKRGNSQRFARHASFRSANRLRSAQQPAVPVIGYLSARSPDDTAHLVAAFRRGLGEQGFVEGHPGATRATGPGHLWDSCTCASIPSDGPRSRAVRDT